MKRLSKRWSLVAVPLAGLLLSGCTAVKVLHVDESLKPAAREAGCKLDIYLKDPPKRPYEVFGEIEYVKRAKTYVGGASTESGSRREALEALNPKACELGADALLINEEDHDRVNMRASLVHYTGQ
jgi:hypothetical protein